MSVYVDQTWTEGSAAFDFNGYGVLQQQGNPLQIWKVRIGELLGKHVDIKMDYDTIVNVLSILYIANNGFIAGLVRTRTIANIDLDKPFGTRMIELPPDPPGGRIFIQILY